MKKINVFLDIDGVIVLDNGYDSYSISLLNYLNEKFNIDFIVSSDRRYESSFEALKNELAYNDLNINIVDITTTEYIPYTSIEEKRANEIKQYIDNHNITNYIIIDDLNILKFFNCANVLNPCTFLGLREYTRDRLYDYFEFKSK